jgi:hypothetical protein
MIKLSNEQIRFISCITSLYLLFSSCQIPASWIKNKADFFESAKNKNQPSALVLKLNTGTFVANDNWKASAPLLIKFNPNQTVQVGYSPVPEPSLLSLKNDTYLQYLQNEISYYYYFDTVNHTIILERFEYRDAPWWNFFVATNSYLTEVFELHGDTLYNQANNRYTRFAERYIVNPNLVHNYTLVVNPFIKYPDEHSPQLDTLSVIKKAKKYNSYWTNNCDRDPSIVFDAKHKTWTVHSSKTQHITRGNCKYTNGCTMVKSVTLVISDNKKKVVSKTKEKKKYPNYE